MPEFPLQRSQHCCSQLSQTAGTPDSIGHPFGMTGARITTTLINGLRSVDKSIGLETMCVGGGQGMAMVLERLS